MPMNWLADKRAWGVLVAGGIIAGVCGWRLATNQPQDYATQQREARADRPAPDFEALDSQNQMFRLQRYLGRHRVLVVFFDGQIGAAHDPRIQAIVSHWDLLKSHDIQAVGVSTALPQENRTAIAAVPGIHFPLVTDIDLSIHDRWARIDPRTGSPLPGVFLIDRKGAVSCFGATPQPVDDLANLLLKLGQQ